MLPSLLTVVTRQAASVARTTYGAANGMRTLARLQVLVQARKRQHRRKPAQLRALMQVEEAGSSGGEETESKHLIASVQVPCM